MSNETICYCFNVSREEIVSAIHQYKPQTIEQLQQHCKASMGCGSCRTDVENIIEEELKKIKSQLSSTKD